jgi:hypothetical protein
MKYGLCARNIQAFERFIVLFYPLNSHMDGYSPCIANRRSRAAFFRISLHSPQEMPPETMSAERQPKASATKGTAGAATARSIPMP